MRYSFTLATLGILTWVISAAAQNLHVSTLAELNASGGVTTDSQGRVYVSDFGPQLGSRPENASIYVWNEASNAFTEFATGFPGASGSCFDADGNLYQASPSGTIAKISLEGEVDYSWWTADLQTPIGLEADPEGNIYVCNCSGNSIGKVSQEGYEVFAESELFACPNGLAQDEQGNLYACNFNDGKVFRIDPDGVVSLVIELPALSAGPAQVGNGHLIYSHGWLYVTTIGRGEVYRVATDGSTHDRIAGQALAFTNTDGPALEATFSKPNGIAASITGDTLYINVSEPKWTDNPAGLHPAKVRMITGVCSLPNSHCDP
ncbi:MAG: hypothetical protein AAFQ98_12190 [Bacteroidota bacterium]